VCCVSRQFQLAVIVKIIERWLSTTKAFTT
jgi:hypothetical protein